MVLDKLTRVPKLQPGQKKGVCIEEACSIVILAFLIHSLHYADWLSPFFPIVPSRAPSNVSFTNVGSTEITVHWSPLPELYANGRLLGYRVYFQKTSYYSYSVSSNASSVNVTNPNATGVILTELNPGQRYRIYVSAFTSKGEGPRSYGYYVTTGMYT